MRILFVTNFYPEFLSELYRRRPELESLDFQEQTIQLFRTGFGLGDAYSAGMKALGSQAWDIVCNADKLQAQWACEHDLILAGNIHDQRRQIVSAQIDDYEPDVVYVFEWNPLGDDFLTRIKAAVPMIVGQIASNLPPNRTFAAYDMMLSSLPPIVEYFRNQGKRSEHFKLGFDERVLRNLGTPVESYDVTFLGGFAPCHDARIGWLERLLQDVPVDIFGYGLERVPDGSPIHQHFRGQAWGGRMYDIIAASKITLHLQAEIGCGDKTSADYANAMRLYEATGVGTCLLTEHKSNISELFAPGVEIETYTGVDEAVAKIKHLLDDSTRRNRMAKAGQARTLAQHTYRHRMEQLHLILSDALTVVGV